MNEQLLSITKDNFSTELQNTETPLLIDFWAQWCAPCRAQNPILEELASEWGDKLRIAKVNVDDDPELAQQFSIMSIPTLILFKDGKEFRQVTGVQTKDQLLTLLAESNLT